jgi:hypothetical protein
MTSRKRKPESDFTGSCVLILTGRYEGWEGVCVGKSTDGSDEVLQLVVE